MEAASRVDNLTPQVIELPAGDYVFVFDEYTVGVERKEVSDLLNTIRADRLRPQLADLMVHYNTPYLLIEGNLSQTKEGLLLVDGRETGWKASAVHGILFGIQEQRIRLALSPSRRGTVERLLNLHTYYRNPDHHDLTNDRLGLFQFRSSPSINMLMSVPGVGMDTARKILEHCGTVEQVAMGSETYLQTIPDIGPKKAHEIWMAFHTEYEPVVRKAG